MKPELETLLAQKNFDQLSKNEKITVFDAITEEEYKQFRAFLVISKTSFEEDYNKLNPDPVIQSRLKAAYKQKFKEKYTQAHSVETKEPKRPILKTILAYSPVAAIVILGAFLFFKLSHKGIDNANIQTTGIDIDQIENFELLHEQMSLKESGRYSKIIIPGTYTEEMSLMRSDTLLMP